MADAKTAHTHTSTTVHGLVAGKLLYETADGRLVEQGHPDAVALLATPGQVIPPKTVARLGLKPEDVASRVPLHLLPELQVTAQDNAITAREKLARAGLSDEEIAERLTAAGLAG